MQSLIGLNLQRTSPQRVKLHTTTTTIIRRIVKNQARITLQQMMLQLTITFPPSIRWRMSKIKYNMPVPVKLTFHPKIRRFYYCIIIKLNLKNINDFPVKALIVAIFYSFQLLDIWIDGELLNQLLQKFNWNFKWVDEVSVVVSYKS